MNLDKKILERIEKDGLRPKPRWFFVGKDFMFLLFVLGSLLASAFAISFFVYFKVYKMDTRLFLLVFWLALATIFFLGAKHFLSKVDKLYKVPNFTVIPMLAAIVLLFGFSFFTQGQTQQAEKKLEKVPIYGEFVLDNVKIQAEESMQNLILEDGENKKIEKDNINITKEKATEDEELFEKGANNQVEKDDFEDEDEIVQKDGEAEGVKKEEMEATKVVEKKTEIKEDENEDVKGAAIEADDKEKDDAEDVENDVIEAEEQAEED